MNARRLFIASAIAALPLVACRAVIGIDGLTYVDGGDAKDATTSDVANDGSTPSDTGTDAHPGTDANVDAGCGAPGGNCFKCCRDTFGPTFFRLQDYAVQQHCLCSPDGGNCASECGSSFCANGNQQPPSMTCGACIDPQMNSNSTECSAALAACANDSNCAPVAACVRSCQPPP